MKDFPP